MKAFLKLFVFIVLILMSSLVFAGLGDGTDFGTDKDRNNTEEQLTPTESQDFGSGKDFSRDNFSQND